MRKATSGLQLGVCLGVILLVFTGGSTTSNLPKEKLLGFVKTPETLESSTFVLTNPTFANQDEEEEAELKKNDFNLPNFAKNNKDENELKKTTMITTTIMSINETNRDIVDEHEVVTNPITITIESTTTSPFFDNELEAFDRTEKLDNIPHADEKQNVPSHPEETRTRDLTTTTSGTTISVPVTTSVPTTNVPVTTSVPTTTMLSSYLSENTEKRLESIKDSTIVTATIRDTSIYENTIDRKDSKKKPIVTEPSVVLENSIQQSGTGYRFNNITSESTSSVSSTGTTESNSIATSTEPSFGTRTSAISLSYVTSESDDTREKPDFTGNGITENSSPITSTQTTILLTPSDISIPAPKTEASTTINEIITSNDYYSTLGTSDSDFSTETTIESSDVSSTSFEPTSSLSSTSSSSNVEYEFIGLTESSTNVFATTSLSSIENSTTTHDLTRTSNVSDSFLSIKSLSETVSWIQMVERVVPGTLSPSTSISTSSTLNSVTNIVTTTSDSNTKSTIVTSTIGSTAESLDPTPIVNVVTLDVPSSTMVTMIRNNKLPTGKKVTDVITAATTAATITTTATTTTEGPPPDEVTSLVKIIFEGTWQDVCPRLEDFRQWLATFLSDGLGKTVTAKQIHFHQNPCNGPPNDETLFSIYVYVVDVIGKFDATATKNLPNLYKSTALDSPITIRSLLLVQETDSSNAIAVVVVSAVAFICLLLLAGLLFVMRKRQTRFNYGERCRPVSLDAYSLDSVSAYNSVRRKGVARSSKRSYGNPAFEDSSVIPSHSLNFAGLSSFSNDVDAINEEFSGIPQVSAKMDELPPGAEVKNRYANVIPLPESKVPLRKLNDDPLSEYINANYVRGPKNATKYYIACQAPLDTTVTDFWRMIWEQQCKVIIMLTDLVENGVEKCTEYIPPSEVTDCHRLYGDFQVTLKKRETKEKYAISTLHLKNLENSTFREVYHIWYLWPTTGPQTDGAGLIAVLLEARALQRGGPGPIVVHCSPGTGRTGTLIALDLGIRQYEITRTVDVPRVVYTIRKDRAGAVQTKEQYAFIYQALNLYATKLAGGMLEST